MDKVSKYNFFTPYGDRVIYYNGISRHIFSLTQTEHKKISTLFQDPITFEIQYNSVYKRNGLMSDLIQVRSKSYSSTRSPSFRS